MIILCHKVYYHFMKKTLLLFVILISLTLSACSISQKASINSNLQEYNSPVIASNENSLVIKQRIPEGTQEGVVNENKIINYPLNEVSVIFNKEISKDSLTGENFYALWGIEDRIPATIYYNSEEKKASLKFDQPIISSGDITRITVILNNIKSKDAVIDNYSYNIDIKN